MKVIVASHESSLSHGTGPHHPERPERVEAVRLGIEGSGLEVVDVEAPPIDRRDLALVHDPAYISMIESFCLKGGGSLDMDTVASEESWEAALRSAGAVKILIDRLRTEEDATGFALTRPPGHHALRSQAMGFCIFNNVAVAAMILRSVGERVAILDWDVHHGNGTQGEVGPDPEILYVSIHQSPFYPFDGLISDVDSEAKGTTINVPVPAGTAGDAYRKAWAEIVMPVMSQFEPNWVLVSAGFDAHVDDFLANLRLEASDYGWMARRIAELHPPERTVFALEGGYDLTALRNCTAATLRGVAGLHEDAAPRRRSPEAAFQVINEARTAVSQHWVIDADTD
jgi:acetoin utilization deacetylase AcuC-like enzyme